VSFKEKGRTNERCRGIKTLDTLDHEQMGHFQKTGQSPEKGGVERMAKTKASQRKSTWQTGTHWEAREYTGEGSRCFLQKAAKTKRGERPQQEVQKKSNSGAKGEILKKEGKSTKRNSGGRPEAVAKDFRIA